jgi:hypothetical protein
LVFKINNEKHTQIKWTTAYSYDYSRVGHEKKAVNQALRFE